MRPEQRIIILNAIGLGAILALTGLIYEETQQSIIFLVGGLIMTVAVMGTAMRKS